MSNLRVLQLVTDSYYPTICGNATVARNFSRIISKTGYCGVLLDNKPNLPAYNVIEGIEVFCVNGGGDTIDLTLRSIIRNRKINIVLMHDGEYPKFENSLRNINNVKKVLINHYYTPKIKELMVNYDTILVFQQYQYDSYIKLGVPKKKIILSSHPIFESEFYDEHTKRKPRSFVYAGRLIKSKGVHKLIPYLNELDATYTIIGPQKDKEYINYLQELIKTYNCEDRVVLLDGTNDKNVLRRIFNEHEIFFLGSESDCYSIVLSEALACGMKAVVRHIDYAYEWCKDMVNFYKPDESNLLEVLKETLETNNFKDNAKKIYDRFNSTKVEKELIANLNRLINNNQIKSRKLVRRGDKFRNKLRSDANANR